MNLLDKKGQSFSAKINGSKCIGKIQVENGGVYLCQNEADGEYCSNKLGYRNSWSVNQGTDSDLLRNEVEDFKLLETKEQVLSRLPKYWAVKGDGGSILFKNTLVPFFKKNYNKLYSGTSDKYYGYDGRNFQNGVYCGDLEEFVNPVTILTLEEFINLTTNNINNTNNLTIKENNHEKSSIKVQRKTSVITSGKRWTGNTISGGRSKVAISIGHLSNSAIYQ